MLLPVIKALLGHYKRHPFQILLVWLGLTLGISLLVGVMAINHHAKQSYSQGEKLFSNPLPYRIRPKHNVNKVPQGLFVELRRQGYYQCVPFDTYRVTTENNIQLNIVGYDPVAMLEFQSEQTVKDTRRLDLMKPPYPVLISQKLAHYLNIGTGDYIRLSNGQKLGPLKVDQLKRISGSRLVMDLARLRQLNKSSGFDVIACAAMPVSKLETLRQMLPNGLALNRNTRVELNSLTQAFHMNLTAMGMLSFMVGLFIFYQAMSLSFTQRQQLVGILRLTGVSSWQLTKAMLVEIAIWVIISWISGTMLGMTLANKLMPTVSASLSDLYNADVGLTVSWSWGWSQISLYMALLGCVLACGWPLVRLIRTKPIRLSMKLTLARFSGREFALQALFACGAIVGAVTLYQGPQTQQTGFVLIALLLVSVGLIMPYLLWKLFIGLSLMLPWIRARWFFADAAASMSYRGVAAMAFMLALATNIGVETIVGSFRDTTDEWLVQRLAADLYITPTVSAAPRMSDWLEQQSEVRSVWWRWEKELASDNGTLQVVSSGRSEGERQALTVKVAVPDYWYKLHEVDSTGVLISESMALKQKLHPGDVVHLPEPLGKDWTVLGIYYDYGNPYSQVILSQREWITGFSARGDVGLEVVLNSDVNIREFIRHVEKRFHLPPDRIYNHHAMHVNAMRVFDQTFKVADTLGKLTLIIAVFGLFFSTIAGEVSRQKQAALLRCLGISGKELVMLGAVQLFVIGVFTSLIALPLGLVMAQLMVDVVLKSAFGWTMDLNFFPWQYLATFSWSLAALFAAGAWPVWVMVKRTPMKLLRDSL